MTTLLVTVDLDGDAFALGWTGYEADRLLRQVGTEFRAAAAVGFDRLPRRRYGLYDTSGNACGYWTVADSDGEAVLS